MDSGVKLLKRFTETNKWRDPWYRKLSCTAKLLWQYLCDNCDNAGVIDFDSEAASFFIGESIEKEHFAELEGRVRKLNSGKLLIPKFIRFQFGELKPTSVIHRSIIALLASHDIPISDVTSHVNPMPMGSRSHQEKEKDKEEVQEKEKEGVTKCYHKDSRTVLHLLNQATGRHFRELDANLSVISCRLNEPEVTLDGVKLMITRQCKRWKGTDQEEYLRPETLFGKSKFDSYYAAKELPVHENNAGNSAKHNPRNIGIAIGPTDYGEAAKRKLERQALEAGYQAAPKTEGT